MDDELKAALDEQRIGDVDHEHLVEHVAACRQKGSLPAHLGELILAFAAARGNPEAVRAFEDLVASDVASAARRIDPTPAFVDEVRQAVRVRLLVAEPDGAPRIAGYTGRGPLRAWVSVAATRVALQLARSTRSVPTPADVLEDVVSSEPDPELRHLGTLYRAEFRQALEEAIAALPERQRALLRLTYVDGLKLAQIGHLYRVHESTASRWLRKAVTAVADGARSRLVSRLSLSPSGVESVARMVRSQLELSIARILGAPASVPDRK